MSESEASKSASGEESEDESHFEYNFNSVEPYENDPEASDDGSSSDDSYEDEDRIAREELEKRYEGIVNVNSWYEAFLIDMKLKKPASLQQIFVFFITGVNAAIVAPKIWLGHVNFDVVKNFHLCWRSSLLKGLK